MFSGPSLSPNEIQNCMSQVPVAEPAKPFSPSGRMIVALMFLLGILATSFLYAYWTLHLMPFMPLQEAIVSEFPGSAPRVDGGQKKMHKDTPLVLRIAMKSEIDPLSEVPADIQEMEKIRTRIAALAESLKPLPGMELLELHVYRLVEEDRISKRSWRLAMQPGAVWAEIDERGRELTVQKNPPAAELPTPAPSTDRDSAAGDAAAGNSTAP